MFTGPGLIGSSRIGPLGQLGADGRRRAPATAAPGAVGAAAALRATLDDVTTLTSAELALLGEWLDRLTAPGVPS